MRVEPPGRSGPAISVDYGALSGMSASLRLLGDALAEPTAEIIGTDTELSHVFERAERDWHTQRAKLRRYFFDAAVSLDKVVATYQAADAETAAAARLRGRGSP